MHSVLRKGPLFTKHPHFPLFFLKTPLLSTFFSKHPHFSLFLQKNTPRFHFKKKHPISFPAYEPAYLLLLVFHHPLTLSFHA